MLAVVALDVVQRDRREGGLVAALGAPVQPQGPSLLEASLPKASAPPEAGMVPIAPPRAPEIAIRNTGLRYGTSRAPVRAARMPSTSSSGV